VLLFGLPLGIVEHHLMQLRKTLGALVCAIPGTVYAQSAPLVPPPAPALLMTSPVASSTLLIRTARVQAIVDDVRERLALAPLVRASAVSENSRMASIARAKGEGNGFVLSIQQDFLDTLTDEELAAVAAHELGHVWIFTHHPFLQTEELANEIALRAVSRASLDRLYDKLWSQTGQKGELEYFPH
jgi:Peptidase family M48